MYFWVSSLNMRLNKVYNMRETEQKREHFLNFSFSFLWLNLLWTTFIFLQMRSNLLQISFYSGFYYKENTSWFVQSYLNSNFQRTLWVPHSCCFLHDNIIIYEHAFLPLNCKFLWTYLFFSLKLPLLEPFSDVLLWHIFGD